ncbi:Cytochrome c4 [Roseomonas mucosa]|uniref:Cytochrome c4 n=3 Tax=Roseomonas TaxID=125216 RepID=A0A4Y1N275_9PROT|nr:c-type cytochrome [Roseomonas mucosa]MBS5902387.1 c-type cytochrome [Acetobacteraceae bacterium]AWV23999.1 Cytochrome c4 [Roseomonas mucosa]MDT8289177.1 c-type cytochrome [Roseomonas mucosa]MDT8312916.1 c-type cytochrome [Roseomonas mucosa]MDT8349410.1 c-type cytochrome [Roseomonas mucosa]
MKRGATAGRLRLLAGLLTLGVLAPGGWMAPAWGAEGDARAGRRLAGGQCAGCHGNDGLAVVPGAPNLAGQVADYLGTQLAAFRSGARQQEQMNLAARELTDAQIADLAAWYASIRVEVEIPGR